MQGSQTPRARKRRDSNHVSQHREIARIPLAALVLRETFENPHWRIAMKSCREDIEQKHVRELMDKVSVELSLGHFELRTAPAVVEMTGRAADSTKHVDRRFQPGGQ